jgi:hypothetical protein
LLHSALDPVGNTHVILMGKYFTSIGDLVGKIILMQSVPKTTSCKSQSIKNWFRLVKTASNLLNRIEITCVFPTGSNAECNKLTLIIKTDSLKKL